MECQLALKHTKDQEHERAHTAYIVQGYDELKAFSGGVLNIPGLKRLYTVRMQQVQWYFTVYSNTFERERGGMVLAML